METVDCRGEKAAAVAGSSQCASRVEPGETFHFKEFDVKSLNVIFVFLSLNKKQKNKKHTVQGFAKTPARVSAARENAAFCVMT